MIELVTEGTIIEPAKAANLEARAINETAKTVIDLKRAQIELIRLMKS